MSTIDVQATGLTMTTGETYGLDPARDIVLTILEGWEGGGTFRRSPTARLGKHGDYAERGYKGAKIISVAGDATFETRQTAAQFVVELECTMADGKAGRLTVIDQDLDLTRWHDVYLSAGPKITRDGTDVEFIFDLIAPDPFKRGDPIQATVDAGQEAEVWATGTADSDQVFELTGSFPSGFFIYEKYSLNALHYIAPVATSGTPLIIDAATGKVTLGENDLSNQLTGRQWTTLSPGVGASYRIQGAGITSASMTVKAIPTWH